MSHQVKLRFWDTVIKRYVSPEHYYINGNGQVFYSISLANDVIRPAENTITEQCIDVQDLNDKDVYENDVVNIIKDGKILDTCWVYYAGSGRYKFKGSLTIWTDVGDYDLEVIGNLNEHPQLLEKWSL